MRKTEIVLLHHPCWYEETLRKFPLHDVDITFKPWTTVELRKKVDDLWLKAQEIHVTDTQAIPQSVMLRTIDDLRDEVQTSLLELDTPAGPSPVVDAVVVLPEATAVLPKKFVDDATRLDIITPNGTWDDLIPSYKDD